MIRFGEWYKVSKALYDEFLDEAYNIVDVNPLQRVEEVTSAMNKEPWLYLRVEASNLDEYKLLYRRNYNPVHMKGFELYTPKIISEWPVKGMSMAEKIIKNSTFGKGDNKMRITEKEEALSNLMREYYEKEQKRINEEFEVRTHDIKVNSEAMKAVSKIHDIAVKNGHIISGDFKVLVDCVPFTCLTQAELAAIENEKVMANEATKELKEKCKECYNLLVLCDTFEERKKLLKKYKIID